MRNILSRVLLVLLFLAACKQSCPPCPDCPKCPKTTGVRGLNPPQNGYTRVPVEMTIAGMCILNTKADNTPFDVLIPVIPGHEPFLYAAADYTLKSLPPLNRTVKRETASSINYDVIILDKEEILMGTPPNEGSLFYTIQGGECPVSFTDGSLRWAPSLSYVLNQPVDINSSYLPPNPTAKMHAYLHVAAGDVSSHLFDFSRWQFSNPPQGSARTQALTGAVVHKFTVDLPTQDQTLVIKRRAFGGTDVKDLVALKAYNGKIAFTIGITLPAYRLPGTAPSANVDDHFPGYYQLLARINDAHGNPLNPAKVMTKPYRRPPPACFRMTTTLVNCGPVRP